MKLNSHNLTYAGECRLLTVLSLAYGPHNHSEQYNSVERSPSYFIPPIADPHRALPPSVMPLEGNRESAVVMVGGMAANAMQNLRLLRDKAYYYMDVYFLQFANGG